MTGSLICQMQDQKTTFSVGSGLTDQRRQSPPAVRSITLPLDRIKLTEFCERETDRFNHHVQVLRIDETKHSSFPFFHRRKD